MKGEAPEKLAGGEGVHMGWSGEDEKRVGIWCNKDTGDKVGGTKEEEKGI